MNFLYPHTGIILPTDECKQVSDEMGFDSWFPVVSTLVGLPIEEHRMWDFRRIMTVEKEDDENSKQGLANPILGPFLELLALGETVLYPKPDPLPDPITYKQLDRMAMDVFRTHAKVPEKEIDWADIELLERAMHDLTGARLYLHDFEKKGWTPKELIECGFAFIPEKKPANKEINWDASTWGPETAEAWRVFFKANKGDL